MTAYSPAVNDYVEWKKSQLSGWVYFKCPDYITIEVFTKPKNEEDYAHSPIHANYRVLVLCYYHQWNELSYVRSRSSIYEET